MFVFAVRGGYRPCGDPIRSWDTASVNLGAEGGTPPGSGDDKSDATTVPDQQRQPQHAWEDEVPSLIEQRVQELLFSRDVTTRIGRFRILEHIGHGGMGQVYAAYDEELDRKVAVKVLLDQDLPSEALRMRFRREAQALARLSHPNVVTVYEVGETDDQLFLAMEFIRGQSIDAWLKTEPDWQEVLDVFIQSGEGLAAAHRAQLVHRDLKPGNLMRGEDGVVKVLDFGLARIDGEPLSSAGDDELSAELESLRTSRSSQLTRPGAIMGTPAYMSPEQFAGEVIDAASDQYSFCVSLFEALYGERPSLSDSSLDLQELVVRQTMITKVSVPLPVRAAVLRGLAHDPGQRWPSMEALLAALSDDPRRRRRRWGLGLAGVGLLGVGVTLAVAAWRDRSERCSGAEENLAGIWDEGRAEQVQAVMLRGDESYAEDAWNHARGVLDAYAGDWVAMHTEACESTLRNEQSSQMLDLRMACLHRAAVDLEVSVDILVETADDGVTRRAHDVVAGLPPLSRCADLDALANGVEPPEPEHSETIDAARRQLARSRGFRHGGEPEAAAEALAAAQGMVEHLEYRPVEVELALEEGSVKEALGDFDGSEAALNRALGIASELEQREPLGEAARGLMHLVGSRKRQFSASLRYWPIVESVFGGRPREEAHARNRLASILDDQGEYDRAEAEHRSALALLETSDAADPLRIARARGDLGRTLMNLGRYDEAEQESRASLSSWQQTLGPSHPDVGTSRYDLAVVLSAAEKYDEAETMFRRALASWSTTLEPDHPQIARAKSGLASVLLDVDRASEALPLAESAWEVAREGDVDPRLRADVSVALGIALFDTMEQGQDPTRTRRLLETALRWCGELGPSYEHELERIQRRLDAMPRAEG